MDGGTEVYGTLVSDIQTDVSVTGKPVYLTASGNDITVDVKKGNMTNPVVTMKPIQNLNGYDSPWVGGAGKNKFDVEKITSQTQTTVDYARTNGGITLSGNVAYTISIGKSISSIAIYGYGGEIDPENRLAYVSSTSSLTFTPESDTTVFIRFYNNTAGGGITDDDIKTIQLEIGSEATAYAPYENICPIYPRTKTEISVNGSVITREYGQEIYGGTDEIATGVVTDDWKFYKIKDLHWTYSSNYGGFFTSSVVEIMDTTTPIVCECYMFGGMNTANSQMVSRPDFSIIKRSNDSIAYNLIRVKDSRFTDADTFKREMGEYSFVCKLYTPREILTTKGYVPLDKGTNEITVSNNDIITFDYYSTLAGKISGTLSYIENGLAPSGYLSGSGNFLALHLDSEDWDIYTSVKVGLYPSEGSGMVEILSDEEKICVGKITSNDQVFMVESTDGTLTKTDVYSLSDLVLETE